MTETTTNHTDDTFKTYLLWALGRLEDQWAEGLIDDDAFERHYNHFYNMLDEITERTGRETYLPC